MDRDDPDDETTGKKFSGGFCPGPQQRRMGYNVFEDDRLSTSEIATKYSPKVCL